MLFYRSVKERQDAAFRWLWLTVVLFADTVPAVGMLMIPKTCAYVWTVLIGFDAMKRRDNGRRSI